MLYDGQRAALLLRCVQSGQRLPEVLVPLLVLWDACHLCSTVSSMNNTMSLLCITDKVYLEPAKLALLAP